VAREKPFGFDHGCTGKAFWFESRADKARGFFFSGATATGGQKN
jgi:hypothetical protein